MKKAKNNFIAKQKRKAESLAGRRRVAAQKLDEIWMTDTRWRMDILVGRGHSLDCGDENKIKNDEKHHV